MLILPVATAALAMTRWFDNSGARRAALLHWHRRRLDMTLVRTTRT
jgi:hypothetical protein